MIPDSYRLIPAPFSQSNCLETLNLTSFRLVNNSPYKEAGELLKESLLQFHHLSSSDSEGNGSVPIRMERKEGAKEEYWISLCPRQIILEGADCKAMVRAIASLLQIIDKEGDRKSVQLGQIHDKPRFSYRGYMLDVSRHFFPLSQIFKILDLLFLYKINVFHWHLTDDQGWRMESRKYPRLTEVGSLRKGTRYYDHYENEEHGGFYSHDDIKKVVEYGKIRGIEIIPEIDFPGHFTAALAAYPQLGCHGKNVEVSETYGILKNVACMGNGETISFIKDLLDEVCDLFPSKLIHLGGDEVPLDSWKSCPKCQKMMVEEGMSHERELQSYGNQKLIEYLESKGRTVVLWNEAFTKKQVPSSAVCQHWFDPPRCKNTLKEINGGRQTIISHMGSYYLDYPYFVTSMKKTYQFNPIFKGVKEDDAILGVETALWTEEVPDCRSLENMMVPRLIAMAERGWSSEEVCDYKRFENLYHKQAGLRQKIDYIATDLQTQKRGLSLLLSRLGFIWKLISVEIKQKLLYS